MTDYLSPTDPRLPDVLARRAAAAERFLDTVDKLEAVSAELLALDLRAKELRGFRRRSCRSLMTFCRNLATDATRALRPSAPRISRLRRETARAALLDLCRPER